MPRQTFVHCTISDTSSKTTKTSLSNFPGFEFKSFFRKLAEADAPPRHRRGRDEGLQEDGWMESLHFAASELEGTGGSAVPGRVELLLTFFQARRGARGRPVPWTMVLAFAG